MDLLGEILEGSDLFRIQIENISLMCCGNFKAVKQVGAVSIELADDVRIEHDGDAFVHMRRVVHGNMQIFGIQQNQCAVADQIPMGIDQHGNVSLNKKENLVFWMGSIPVINRIHGF